jgi:hypothetical protein
LDRRPLTAALVFAAAGLVGACATSGHDRSSAATPAVHAAADRGRLVGAIVYSGGPAPGVSDRPQPGHVRVLHAGRVVDTAHVREGHRFSFRLKPRRYRLVIKSGDARCPKKRVAVHASHVTHVRVTCDVR